MSDLKEHGGKVMTFSYSSGLHGMTIGKNYNVKNYRESMYSCVDDFGDERFIAKIAFKNTSEANEEAERSKIRDMMISSSGSALTQPLGEYGAKHDSNKLKPTLLVSDMPLAINEVLKVLKFGAEKYSEGNWLKVEDGISRYRNAGLRHLLASEELDDESGLSHLSHAVTSLLMELELRLRKENAK